MRVQLKETEIKKALRLLLNARGINTTGKSITIEFTSGRKENGLTADIDINGGDDEDDEIPGFTDADNTPTLGVAVENGRAVATSDPVVPAQAKKVAESAATETKKETSGDPTEVAPVAPADTVAAGHTEAAPEAVSAPAKSAGSLFGNPA